MTVLLLVLAGVAAVADWAAVHRRLVRAEYVLKPATLALLVAAAATADLGRWKFWTVAALVLGLLGDIALLFTNDRRAGREQDEADPAFLAGLGAFLLGHLAYLVAFLLVHEHTLRLLAGVLVVAGVSGLTLGPVLRGARREGGTAFAAVVAGYAPGARRDDRARRRDGVHPDRDRQRAVPRLGHPAGTRPLRRP